VTTTGYPLNNGGGAHHCLSPTTAYVEQVPDVARTRVGWRRLRQRNPGTDGDTRQRGTHQRDCYPVVVSIEIVVGVELLP